MILSIKDKGYYLKHTHKQAISGAYKKELTKKFAIFIKLITEEIKIIDGSGK